MFSKKQVTSTSILKTPGIITVNNKAFKGCIAGETNSRDISSYNPLTSAAIGLGPMTNKVIETKAHEKLAFDIIFERGVNSI